MSFPLIYVLYAYFGFLVFWFIFSAVGVYHLLKYGFKNFFTFFIIVLYIAVSVGLLLFSYYFLAQFDWDINISLLNIKSINNF